MEDAGRYVWESVLKSGKSTDETKTIEKETSIDDDNSD